MNISHRSLWNSALGAWVAVSEITRGRGKRSSGGSAVLAGAVLLLIGAVPTLGFAQSTWNQPGNGAWTDAANWTGGIPGANSSVGVYQGTAQITTDITIRTLGGGAGGTITLSATGSLTVATPDNANYAGVINGAGGLTKQGTGSVSLSGTNTYSGATTILGGRLIASGVNSLSANSALTLANGGGALLTIGADQTIGSLAGGGTGGGGVNLQIGSAKLSIGNDNTSTRYDGRIAGDGGLIKLGTGTQTLAGNSIYFGATSINAGTLTVNGSIAGSAVSINSGGTLSGSGTVSNTTVASGGTLKGSAGQVLTTGALVLNSGANVDMALGAPSNTGLFQVNGDLTLGGKLNVSDLGGFGAGVYRIFNYTGGLTNNGFLIGTAPVGSALTLQTAVDKEVNLVNTAGQTLKFWDGSAPGSASNGAINGGTGTWTANSGNWTDQDGTSNGAMTPAPSFAVFQGTAGTVTTDSSKGALAVTGMQFASDGYTLQGDAITLSGPTPIIRVGGDGSGNKYTATIASVLTGNAGLEKTDVGTLVLTGANTYTGGTSVNAGTLSVNGSIASSVTVNNGATLGGNGTVGSLNVMSGGVLAPGNSIGLLKVNGNATFAAGSTYRVEVNAAGNNDRTNITGTATLTGGKVDVQAAAGTYAANTTYTVLNAAGGRTGTFAGVTSNLAFLTPTLGYDANNVFLTLARNDISYNAVATTPNQGSTSTALQNAVTGASGDMSTVLGALTGLSAEQARAAYDSVGGSSLVGLRGAGSSFAAGFGNQMQARMGAMQSSSAGGTANAFANRPVLLAANDHISDLMASGTVSDSPQKFSLAGGAASSNLQSKNDPANGFWLRGNGGYQNTNRDNNASASKVRSSSLSAGFDTEVREGLRAGVALSSGSSSLSTDVNASGKSRGSAVALYGSYASGPWNFSGSTSLAHGNNHMDRTVMVGAINRVATSDFDSRTLSAYGEATYSMAMTGGWTLQPLAGLSLSRSKADGFTETGAGALNLQVAGQTTTSTKSLLGAKAAFEAGSVRLEPRAIWAHEFGDINTPMTAQFQGAANASPFQVSGVALKRDTLILGLGASGSIKKNFDLFADVQAEHNSRQNNLAVLVGLRARW